MMLMLVLQIVLGIVTVLYSAPWYFAILHQFGAVVLIVLILRARFFAMYPVRQIREGSLCMSAMDPIFWPISARPRP
jgi:cytochrome c oxidase assembly protein subunit 15